MEWFLNCVQLHVFYWDDDGRRRSPVTPVTGLDYVTMATWYDRACDRAMTALPFRAVREACCERA